MTTVALLYAEEVDVVEIPTEMLLTCAPSMGRMNLDGLSVVVVPFIDVFIEEWEE